MKRLQKTLNNLSNLAEQQVIKEALGKTAGIFKSAVEPKVPVATRRWKKGVGYVAGGEMKKSLTKSLNNKLTKKGYVSSRVGYKRPGGNASHLVDLGTDERWTKKGQYRGKVRPRLFHSGTFNQMRPQLEKQLAINLIKAIKRLWGGA